MNELEYSEKLKRFLTEKNIFVVRQEYEYFDTILAIFDSKQEAENYLKRRKGCLDYVIDTVQFCCEEEVI